jgi:hypothetical protein
MHQVVERALIVIAVESCEPVYNQVFRQLMVDSYLQ